MGASFEASCSEDGLKESTGAWKVPTMNQGRSIIVSDDEWDLQLIEVHGNKAELLIRKVKVDAVNNSTNVALQLDILQHGVIKRFARV